MSSSVSNTSSNNSIGVASGGGGSRAAGRAMANSPTKVANKLGYNSVKCYNCGDVGHR